VELADELDCGGLNDEPAPPPVPPPPPATLPRIPLFSSLPAAELRHLIDRMVLRELVSGDVVIRQGERGGSLFVVVEGKVRVVAAQDGQPPRELALLGAGAFFGEMGLLTDEPRSATVFAERETQLLELPREVAWEIARRSPEVLRTLLRFFRDRVLDRLIERSPLFSGLSPDDARALAGQFVFLELEAGVTPVKQGERAPGMFFLLCGAAAAVRDGVTVGTLGPGDIFGEMSLLLRAPASADVRATRKSWALQLPQPRFQEIMVTYPQVLAYVSELGDQRRALLSAPQDLPEGKDSNVDLL